MLRRIINACSSPLETCRKFSRRVRGNSTAEPPHAGLWRQYSRLARAQGLDQLYLLLSFDCDTPEDIAAVAELDPWLAGLGVKRTYAVPGEQLAQGASTYRDLADNGADFMNHGQRPHARKEGDRYWPMTFYNEMSAQEVAQDIHLGHETCQKVLGGAPSGFRAPHFGYYQEPAQREVIYGELRRLGYRYSSSTIAHLAFQHGPVIKVNGLYEIPLSGSLPSPHTILDSWNYIISPQQPTVTEKYADLFIQTVDGLLAMGTVGVLNYYVDPAHVCGQAAFERAIGHALKRNLETLDYDALLDLIERAGK